MPLGLDPPGSLTPGTGPSLDLAPPGWPLPPPPPASPGPPSGPRPLDTHSGQAPTSRGWWEPRPPPSTQSQQGRGLRDARPRPSTPKSERKKGALTPGRTICPGPPGLPARTPLTSLELRAPGPGQGQAEGHQAGQWQPHGGQQDGAGERPGQGSSPYMAPQSRQRAGGGREGVGVALASLSGKQLRGLRGHRGEILIQLIWGLSYCCPGSTGPLRMRQPDYPRPAHAQAGLSPPSRSRPGPGRAGVLPEAHPGPRLAPQPPPPPAPAQRRSNEVSPWSPRPGLGSPLRLWEPQGGGPGPQPPPPGAPSPTAGGWGSMGTRDRLLPVAPWGWGGLCSAHPLICHFPRLSCLWNYM